MLSVSRLRDRRHDEGGAVAVVFALMLVMLCSLAALGTDLGNQIARNTSNQTQADFGAFAAGGQITGSEAVGSTPSNAILNAVATALNRNQPQDDRSTQGCWRTKTCVAAADLKDLSIGNGEVQFTAAGLKVTAPKTRVGYGMAKVMGKAGAFVQRSATINVFSPGQRVMPLFAFNGCDYGKQTLIDPAVGHAVPVVPTLAYNTEPSPANSNQTKLESLVLNSSTGAVVTSLAANSTGNVLKLTASKWNASNYIGFFRGDDTTPSLVQTVAVPAKPYTSNPSTTVTVTIPDAVAQTQTVWWVRVFDGAGTPTATPHVGQWSNPAEALPIPVGNAVLQCNFGSSDGNFGTLKLPRTDDVPANWLPDNIATGLQSPLTLAKHAQADATGLCTGGVNGAVISPTSPASLVARTNCVGTDTGLSAQVATSGLISGSGSVTGLLTRASTKSGCDPTGGGSNRTITANPTNFTIENNVLTCYLLPGKDLQTISQSTYSGGAAFDKSLVADPRFIWVPILKVQPSQGSSNYYSIIDVRPGFITDETVATSTIKGTHTASADNGVKVTNGKIELLNVIFFNADALPRDHEEQVISYLGVGPRIIRLIQ